MAEHMHAWRRSRAVSVLARFAARRSTQPRSSLQSARPPAELAFERSRASALGASKGDTP